MTTIQRSEANKTVSRLVSRYRSIVDRITTQYATSQNQLEESAKRNSILRAEIAAILTQKGPQMFIESTTLDDRTIWIHPNGVTFAEAGDARYPLKLIVGKNHLRLDKDQATSFLMNCVSLEYAQAEAIISGITAKALS